MNGWGWDLILIISSWPFGSVPVIGCLDCAPLDSLIPCPLSLSLSLTCSSFLSLFLSLVLLSLNGCKYLSTCYWFLSFSFSLSLSLLFRSNSLSLPLLTRGILSLMYYLCSSVSFYLWFSCCRIVSPLLFPIFSPEFSFLFLSLSHFFPASLSPFFWIGYFFLSSSFFSSVSVNLFDILLLLFLFPSCLSYFCLLWACLLTPSAVLQSTFDDHDKCVP